MGAPDETATEILGPAAATTAGRAPELIGRTLGKFQIVEPLGKGGSGEVYRAEQVQLGRSVVIKVLRHEVAWSPNRVERFLREAKLASRLDHPYAAHVYAFGAEADGVLWIAMEHVKGMTLDELVARRGALPPSVFAPLFGRLCEVVHSAHELGIVHRDIKGSNVMVIERAGQLLPKLLDFGIAKGGDGGVTPGVEGDKALTSHGTTLGSPHYMSPEQWERPSEVDGRADVYALGVLAYRCSCGNLPFPGTDRRKLAAAHLHEPPPPLPELVPPAIADAIYRALQKDPNARWPTAVAFADAIRTAANTAAPEVVPLFDPGTRDAWLRAGPQPIADAIAHLAAATTTVEADAAVRELVAISCRWLAVLALAGVAAPQGAGADPLLRERARRVVGSDDAAPWLELAKAAASASGDPLPGLVAALAGADSLAALAARLDDRDRPRTAAALAADITAASDALRPLEPLLAYQLVLGVGNNVAESWQGARRRDRERVVVWSGLAAGEVGLLDGNGTIVARLSPLAQVVAPLPSAEPELFLLWRSSRGHARLVAAPWGFERDDDAAGRRLAALSTEDSDTQHDAADEVSPYPGLAAYGSSDADWFVGRERETEALANRLVRAPMLAVLGPSGVGKSSFLHAGLVPRLGEHHAVRTIRPGRHPMHALAQLGDLRALGELAPRGLVLVVDQLEELVTLCADPDERRAFASALAAAADGPSAPVRVVASLRDDFATVIEGEDDFRGRFEVFVLATPPPEALRRIVVEPARRAAVSIDPRVVDDMVAEVAGRPASLPLLSFTASQLWQTRDKAARAIRHDAYVALGGVAGALATYADEIYGNLSRTDQQVVRDLFARLVATDGTRVPWPRGELEALPAARKVIAHLVDARLLVLREDAGPKDDVVVEIVHECLAERWPRLARWRSEDAADRALLGDVRAAARRWQEANRRADLLWRGEALAELRKLAARTTALTSLEREFADHAVAAALRARRIRRGVVAAVMIVLAAIAGVMAYLSAAANESRAEARRDQAKAQEAARLAEDRLTQSLIAQGRRELNDGRAVQSLAYFAAAMQRGADSPGLREMVSIANRGWHDVLVIERDVSPGITSSPNGWIAAGDHDGHLRWWSDTGARLGDLELKLGEIGSVRRLADDGVVVAGRDGVAHVDAAHHLVARIPTTHAPWFGNVGPAADELTLVHARGIEIFGADGTKRRSIDLPLGDAIAPAFDTSGRHMFYILRGTLYVIDLVSLESHAVTANVSTYLSGAADGSIFGYLDKTTHDVRLLDGAGKPAGVLHPTVRGEFLMFSATGDRVATFTEREVEVLDRAGKQISMFPLEDDENVLVIEGDDLWTAKAGVLRRYHGKALVASLPVETNPVYTGVIARGAFAVVSSNDTLAIVRSSAQQYKEDKLPCTNPDELSYGGEGIATYYICDDITHVYVGRQYLGHVPISSMHVSVAYDPATQRSVVGVPEITTVLDRDAKPLAHVERRYGAFAFEDADHVLVAESRKSLWRWTVSTNAWQELAPMPDASAIAALGAGAYAIGTGSSDVIFYRAGRETGRTQLARGRVVYLVATDDRRWLAAQLEHGDTAILDATTGKLERMLEPADSSGATATFDAGGDLLLRASRDAITIWDRASGEDLVFGLDLLRYMQNARFLPDGRIETGGMAPGLLDIPRDTRPKEQIVRDIACRVPFVVDGGRLEPRAPECKPP
ncbi:MAG: protein kinase domain-containing protein [Acidobacteriota bacterium]